MAPAKRGKRLKRALVASDFNRESTFGACIERQSTSCRSCFPANAVLSSVNVSPLTRPQRGLSRERLPILVRSLHKHTGAIDPVAQRYSDSNSRH